MSANGLPSEDAIARWAETLRRDEALLMIAWKAKRWTPAALERLGVGFDGERFTIPIRDGDGKLVNVIRYAPGLIRENGTPKALAVKDARRDLFPAPETIEGDELFLHEGEPDTITATSAGLPAIGIPGTQGWKKGWAKRFADRAVFILLDCDPQARSAAEKIAKDLLPYAESVRLIDLDPSRDDGYDLADFLADADSPDELRQARAMIYDLALSAKPLELPPEDGPAVTWASDVKRERVEWLWPGVPRSTLTIFMGFPGVGKSMLTCKLAAEATQRGEYALILSAEDSPEFMIEPRLAAVDARMDRVGFLSMRRSGFLEDLALPDDFDSLREVAQRYRPALIVIDPLAAHFGGGVDAFRDPSVRRALAPLRRLAEETRVAIVVVIHLNKSGSTDPILRAGGSIGQMGAARSALLVANDPDGEDGMDRVVAHVKCNVAPKAPSMRFRIEPVQLDNGDSNARIVEVGEADYSGRDLLAAALDTGTPGGGGKLQQAITFLVMRLGDGPKEAEAVVRDARMIGISESTLRNAKKELGVKSGRINVEGADAGEGFWTWRLPDPGEATSADEDDE